MEGSGRERMISLDMALGTNRTLTSPACSLLHSLPRPLTFSPSFVFSSSTCVPWPLLDNKLVLLYPSFRAPIAMHEIGRFNVMYSLLLSEPPMNLDRLLFGEACSKSTPEIGKVLRARNK